MIISFSVLGFKGVKHSLFLLENIRNIKILLYNKYFILYLHKQNEKDMEKLIKIQSELKAPKNQFNAFGKYNYRSCEDILEAVKPLLKKYNCSLIVTDEIKEVAGITFVESTCKFWDNELTDIEVQVTAQAGVDINRKGMDIAQCFGSSSSYARKYALNGLFLIDDTKDSDATNTHEKQEISNDRFEKACQQIKEGKYTIEKLKATFKLTELQEKALLTL